MNAFANPSHQSDSAFKREMFLHQLESFEMFRHEEGRISPEEAEASAHLSELSAKGYRKALAVGDHEAIACFVPQELERQKIVVEPGSPA